MEFGRAGQSTRSDPPFVPQDMFNDIQLVKLLDGWSKVTDQFLPWNSQVAFVTTVTTAL
jgi:hypothetical protein